YDVALLGRLDGDFHHDLVANNQAAVLERTVEVDSEITAVNLGAGLEAGDNDTRSHAGTLAQELQVKGDGLGDALDGHVGYHLELVVALGGDLRGLQFQRWVLLLFEEVRALEVIVTHLVIGRDAGGLDTGLDLGVPYGVAHGDDSGKVKKVATDLGGNEVTSDEAHAGVNDVDVVDAGSGKVAHE